MESAVDKLQREIKRNEQDPRFITEYEKYIQLSHKLAEIGITDVKTTELMSIEERHAFKSPHNQIACIKL